MTVSVIDSNLSLNIWAVDGVQCGVPPLRQNTVRGRRRWRDGQVKHERNFGAEISTSQYAPCSFMFKDRVDENLPVPLSEHESFIPPSNSSPTPAIAAHNFQLAKQPLPQEIVPHGRKVRRLEAISPPAESTEGNGINVRDRPPPLLSSAVRRGEIDPVSKREPSPSKGISTEMSQTATDSRTRIKSPLDPIEDILANTAHSSIPTSRTEPSCRLGSVRPDGSGDGGKVRDGGRQGGGISKTTAEALPPPTKAMSPPPEQPLNKPDANALHPTLLGSPLNKPLDMISSLRMEASDSGLSMENRRLQPTLPAAVPAQGHGVNLGEPLPPAPPPHSSGSRQLSTFPAPSITAGSSIPTSRFEPSHLASTRPEGAGGSGRAGGGEQQRGGIPRETTEVPSIGADGPRTQAARAIPISKSHSKLTPNVPGTTQCESPGFISRSTTSLFDEKNPPTVSPQNIQPMRTSQKTGDGSSSHQKPRRRVDLVLPMHIRTDIVK
ncbi:hypothetical protein BGW80DRAFT_1444624, partial [Lactifluus volemus]